MNRMSRKVSFGDEMTCQVTRRDFLKLSGLLPLSLAVPQFIKSLQPSQQDEESQNVLIIVFDAFSAHNISLYGYPRETMPKLAKLAERAIVYHNHYAGGIYTTPGTASLLTGVQPWTHRAFPQSSTVDEAFVSKNIFTAFQNYYRVAYSHNIWVYTFLNQFRKHLDKYIPLEEYLLESDAFIPKLFRYDSDIATLAWNRTIKKSDDGFSYSLFLSELYKEFEGKSLAESAELKKLFPEGVPKNGHYPYLLEQAVDPIGDLLTTTKQPFLGYFHFYPPHDPYNTHQEFHGAFENDGYIPLDKPLDTFHDYEDPAPLSEVRRAYDEFILYVDREFDRLFRHLDENGVLDNTWVVLTSDHGEMFERGIRGHSAPSLYDPLIRIPLLIFEPGRRTRADIHAPTSAIDLLPTLLHVTGQQPAAWTEGAVLPPFSNAYPEANRNVYVLEAKRNEKYAPFTVAATATIKGNYKLMYSFGYEELGGEERIELYDLEKDPEELNDLSTLKRETTAEMLNAIRQKLAEVNEPYE